MAGSVHDRPWRLTVDPARYDDRSARAEVRSGRAPAQRPARSVLP